jgi:5-methylcytosine-specific restriction protein A
MSNSDKRLSGWKLQKIRHLRMMETPLCLHCQAKGIVKLGEELDHIVPISKGGTNDGSNLQMLCKQCHLTKTINDLGYRPKAKIGLDGWPQEEDNSSKGGGH